MAKSKEEMGESKRDNEKVEGNHSGLARHEHAGLEHVPAYHTVSDVPMAVKSKGIAVRPASYTNRRVAGTGVANTPAYVRKGGELAK